MKHAGGRPTDYTPELADEICEAIENSPRGLNHHAADNAHWPAPSTIRRWLSQIEQFQDKYSKAKEKQAEFMADEMTEIAYDDKHDWRVIVDSEGNEKTVHVAESVNRARLKIDTLKWHASKLAPKKYGEKIQSSHVTEGTLLEKLIDKL